MQYSARLINLVLIAAIAYLCFLVYSRQRESRFYEQTATELEQQLNDLLIASSDEIQLVNIKNQFPMTVWLYSLPPGKSLAIHMSKETDGIETTQWNRISADHRTRRGLIQMEATYDAASPSNQKAKSRAVETISISGTELTETIYNSDKKAEISGFKFTSLGVSKANPFVRLKTAKNGIERD